MDNSDSKDFFVKNYEIEKNDISFDTAYHDIYNPSFSSKNNITEEDILPIANNFI